MAALPAPDVIGARASVPRPCSISATIDRQWAAWASDAAAISRAYPEPALLRDSSIERRWMAGSRRARRSG